MTIGDAHGLPVAISIESASPHEVTLVDGRITKRFVKEKPDHLVGDLAYDSDPLDAEMKRKHGIEVIAPHKENRIKPVTQDGRALRRFKRRWKIERFWAWLRNFRRLATRNERHGENFLGFIHLACAIILLRSHLINA